MVKILGRIAARKGKIAGVFIPFVSNGLKSGVWEVVEFMGELQLRYVGKQAMRDAQYNSIDVAAMVGNPYAAMTEKELASIDNTD